jgi:restriction system protein
VLSKSFERELVRLFKDRGYEVEWTGRSGWDGGVHILLKANGKKIIVQCNAHKDYVGLEPVRDLYGTLMDKKADEAWLITTWGFWGGAACFASGKPIRLLTIRDVLAGEGAGPASIPEA